MEIQLYVVAFDENQGSAPLGYAPAFHYSKISGSKDFPDERRSSLFQSEMKGRNVLKFLLEMKRKRPSFL